MKPTPNARLFSEVIVLTMRPLLRREVRDASLAHDLVCACILTATGIIALYGEVQS